MQKEPVVIVGAIEAAVIAIIGVIAASAGWDADFTALVVGAAGAIVALIAAIVARMRVFSPATHEAEVQAALMEPPPAGGGK